MLVEGDSCLWLRVFEPFIPRQIPQSHPYREIVADLDMVELDSKTGEKVPSMAEVALKLIEQL